MGHLWGDDFSWGPRKLDLMMILNGDFMGLNGMLIAKLVNILTSYNLFLWGIRKMLRLQDSRGSRPKASIASCVMSKNLMLFWTLNLTNF